MKRYCNFLISILLSTALLCCALPAGAGYRAAAAETDDVEVVEITDPADNTTETDDPADPAETCAHETWTREVTKEPACTEAGEATLTCVSCGKTRTEAIEPLGHAYEKAEGSLSPTCIETGVEILKCARCGDVRTEAVPALGHDYESTVIVEPACATDGLASLTCLRCGETHEETVKRLGHTYGAWATTKRATYREAGEAMQTCTVCGFTRTRVLGQLTHLPAESCAEGDANMDGIITAADARLILRLAVGFDDGLDDAQKAKADYDGENGVTASDARTTLRVAVGLIAFTPQLLEGYTLAGYTSKGYPIAVKDGITYIVTTYGYTLIANKTYSLPADYAPGGLTTECQSAFNELANAAAAEGLNIYELSGYRSYETQQNLYNRYVAQDGQAEADTYSARPGHSEHQTGLALDVNSVLSSFAYTSEGIWLAENAWRYGFIIRYAQEKESITGYIYEPWHIRYVGKELAAVVTEKGVCLEEFFGITSVYE